MTQLGYQVIARRWRPKTFNELVGQDHIVKTLSNAIEKNRIAHAYLFVGPRGTGKTSTARLFAQALNCTNGPSITPPENCPICKAIASGSCMDVVEIDGASNNSVDQIRDLREECQYAPTQAKYKIYIIDEVHMLSTAAFNALLKILEEPPSHVKFFFATTEANKVLPTIVSRCQRFEFRPISESVITEKLKLIGHDEGINAEDAVYKYIARMSAGGMRDSQSILDQLISFCGKDLTESDVLTVYGLASQDEMMLLAEAIASCNFSQIITLSRQFIESGKDFLRIIIDLQYIIHNALLNAIQNKGISSLLNTPLSTESLMRMLECLKDGELSLKTGLSEEILFELTLMKTAEASKLKAIDYLIHELATAIPKESLPLNPTLSIEQIKSAPIPEEPTTSIQVEENSQDILPSIKSDMDELFRAQFKGIKNVDLAS